MVQPIVFTLGFGFVTWPKTAKKPVAVFIVIKTIFSG